MINFILSKIQVSRASSFHYIAATSSIQLNRGTQDRQRYSYALFIDRVGFHHVTTTRRILEMLD
jgi:hypothetical protein